MKQDEIYIFDSDFGLANAIKDYFRLKNRVVCVVNYYSLMLIDLIWHNKSDSD